MKNIFRLLTVMVVVLFFITAHAKAQQVKQTIAVLHIESHGISLDSATVVDLTRVEIEKTGRFNVMNKYDVADALVKAGIDIKTCRGRECIAAAGKAAGSDNVLTGEVETFPNKIVVSLRIIEAATADIRYASTMEFLLLPSNAEQMISITMETMLGLPVNHELLKSLTEQSNYENAVNNPDEDKVNLSGPRTGLTFFTGDLGKAYQLPKESGGYGWGKVPFMWNFGWQFETQFINSGYSQALFEYYLNVGGIDKGKIFPSATLLIGYRYNKYGLEFGIGPIFSIVRKAKMTVPDSSSNTGSVDISYPSPDGDPAINSGLMIAAGKTFKSGKMNIPVNLYVIPRQEGLSYGFSVGFNIKKNKQIQK